MAKSRLSYRYRFHPEGFIGFLDLDPTNSNESLRAIVTGLEKQNNCIIYFVLYRNRRGQWMGSPWDKPSISFHKLGTMKEADEEALRYYRRRSGGGATA